LEHLIAIFTPFLWNAEILSLKAQLIPINDTAIIIIAENVMSIEWKTDPLPVSPKMPKIA